jgi:hypothetical protein
MVHTVSISLARARSKQTERSVAAVVARRVTRKWRLIDVDGDGAKSFYNVDLDRRGPEAR